MNPQSIVDDTIAEMPTICLAMIVKNEEPVIERCLRSVLHLIDSYVIADTGSSDATKEKISAFFEKHSEKQGELLDHEWVDFGTNRNLVLKKARKKADYTLFIDADEELFHENGRFLAPQDKLNLGATLLKTNCKMALYTVKYMGSEFPRYFLVRNNVYFEWRDPVHEYLHCDEEFTPVLIAWVNKISHEDGARALSGKKLESDIELLEKQLEKEEKPRYLAHLARSYFNVGEYEKVSNLCDRYFACKDKNKNEIYNMYRMRAFVEKQPGRLLHFAKAFEEDPTRTESLLDISKFLRQHGCSTLAYEIGKLAFDRRHARTDGKMFVDKNSYGWGLWLELSRAAYTKKPREPLLAAEYLQHVIADENAPQEVKDESEKCLAFIRK